MKPNKCLDKKSYEDDVKPIKSQKFPYAPPISIVWRATKNRIIPESE
jgi:hypothetical protein